MRFLIALIITFIPPIIALESNANFIRILQNSAAKWPQALLVSVGLLLGYAVVFIITYFGLREFSRKKYLAGVLTILLAIVLNFGIQTLMGVMNLLKPCDHLGCTQNYD